jgi:hypothetical protein
MCPNPDSTGVGRKTNAVKPPLLALPYSVRRDFTGLVNAALIAW